MTGRTRWAAGICIAAGLTAAAALPAAGALGFHAPLRAAATPTAVFLEAGGTPGASPTALQAQTPTHTVTHAPAAPPTASASPTVVPSATPAPFVPPTVGPIVLGSPSATATTPAATYGALDHAVLYDNGNQLALLQPQARTKSGLSFLSTGSGKRPRYSGAWEYVYYNNGFWFGDIYGHQHQVVAPAGPGEQVYDAIPSPDGQYIAWQMVTAGTVGGFTVNTAASRIVISDSTGGNARTLLQQAAGKDYGDIPLIFGWRAGKPPTLLVQTNYAVPSMLGLHKGLEEFDPGTLDMVNDYLPPLSTATLPQGEVVGVSSNGGLVAFASRDAHLPSGEGPFPTNLLVMSTASRRSVLIDMVTTHHDKATKKLPAPRAAILNRQAFFSPDNTRIAYTRLDIIYPKGAINPYIRPVACLANVDGSNRADFGQDERVMGWIDAQTVLVRRENTRTNGLYAVDLTTGKTTLILLGNAINVDGIIP